MLKRYKWPPILMASLLALGLVSLRWRFRHHKRASSLAHPLHGVRHSRETVDVFFGRVQAAIEGVRRVWPAGWHPLSPRCWCLPGHRHRAVSAPILASMLVAITIVPTAAAHLDLIPGAGTELYRGVGAIVLFGILSTAVVSLTFLPALCISVLKLAGYQEPVDCGRVWSSRPIAGE